MYSAFVCMYKGRTDIVRLPTVQSNSPNFFYYFLFWSLFLAIKLSIYVLYPFAPIHGCLYTPHTNNNNNIQKVVLRLSLWLFYTFVFYVQQAHRHNFYREPIWLESFICVLELFCLDANKFVNVCAWEIHFQVQGRQLIYVSDARLTT